MRLALCDSLCASFWHLAEIGVDDDLLLARERLADGLRVHVGVAVHVAADPGAEVQQRRQLERFRRRRRRAFSSACAISS